MSITSSVLSVGHLQEDGRRYVVELHTDNAAVVHRVEYLAVDGADYNAIMLARVPVIESALMDGEAEACVNEDKLSTVYVTKAQLAAWAREQYRNGNKERLARIARWILNRIAAGDFTETQVRNAFGLTTQQWNTLKAKMQNLADSLNAIDSATGE